MGVDGGVTGGSGEVFVFAVGDMLLCFRVAVFLRKTEINNVNLIRLFPEPDEVVIRFNIPMYEILSMQKLNSRYGLIRYHQHCLQ
jgi:hypothetical protein